MTTAHPTPAPTPPSPADPDYPAYAKLANDVTRALHASEVWLTISDQVHVAERLWAAGYRPTPEQVAQAALRRLRTRDALDAQAEQFPTGLPGSGGVA